MPLSARTKTLLPYAAFATCGVVWGTTFLFIRESDEVLPPLWGCFLRLALACVILNAIVLASGGKWPQGAALRAAFWFGLWDFGIHFPLLYLGERSVPSGLTAVLYATSPVAAIFESRLLGMERISIGKLIAAVIALAGTAIIFWRELLTGGSVIGIITVIAAAAAGVFSALMLQRGPKQSAIGANAVGTLVGAPMCLLWSFSIGERHPVPNTYPTIFPVVYLAIFGSVIAFGSFAWLLNHWRTSTVAFLGVVVPVIAVILGSLIRHETFSPATAVGAAVIIVGVVVAPRTDGRIDEAA